ncbi:MAG: 30S ribosomal protein S17 [Acidobacteria bacterium]|nr:30S ribosomal protein S17 [Acidobacteriota bacterium]MBK8813022.1 30S ribosomal protein S17 [Acidobacteriota bacterium]
MPRKKKDEQEEVTAAEVTETDAAATDETVAETAAETTEAVESAADATETAEEVSAPVEVEEAPEAVAPKVQAKAEPVAEKSETTADAKHGKRAERVGVVASDKMTKTVVVRVDRLIKHPIYRKYVKRRKNFMAHDELGAAIGDKVRIVETRPLSARKRWRVVEIIQKAEK